MPLLKLILATFEALLKHLEVWILVLLTLNVKFII